MKEEQKNFFFTPQLFNIFQKHDWHILSNSKKNVYFHYRGEIADYYLMLSYNKHTIKFNYTLDIMIPKDKIKDLLMLINFLNQNTKDGFFTYNLEANKIKFDVNKQYFVKSENNILKDIIEKNLITAKYIFRNFSLATHNLIYAEKIDRNSFGLMFSKIEGCA